MAKTKKGDVFSCEMCGLIVSVDQGCNCAEERIICCDVPMKKGKTAAARLKKAGNAAKGFSVESTKKAAAKKVAGRRAVTKKAVAKKAAPAKKAVKGKTANKRAAAKKKK
ncbi:MAG: hypothetical protein ACE14T_06100 [Syntrophales bacterium]